MVTRGAAGGLLLLLLLSAALALAPSSEAQSGSIGMVCSGTGPTFHLETATGHITTPDGNSIFMWGFRPVGGRFQVPGPVLCVNEGDTVTVSLTNSLSEPASIVFPGQSGVHAEMASGTGNPGLFTLEANPGETVRYRFVAREPGTYLYESGTNPEKQVQMGLYGVLVVRPSLGPEYAYDDPSTRFDPEREFLIVLSEIDPGFHRRVELGREPSLGAFDDDYWLVNGRSFPDTIADNGASWLPSQPYGALVRVEPYDPATNPYPALIRYVNAGMVNHPFHPHGNHLRVIARDGRLLRGPGGEDTSFEDFTRTIGAGQTYDLLFRWDDVDPWVTGGAPVPVTIPGLQNLVFKDGATFYSGDPRLGLQGELPVGVTSYNECGELYFPWHSHALFEFTNFDEGFGGLATLLRVDPPGGCGAGPPPMAMHVGDLDGSAVPLAGGRWRARVVITVHDLGHDPIPDAAVVGRWSAGDRNGRTELCITDDVGECELQSGRLSKSLGGVVLTISGLSADGYEYLAVDDHDPDGDSSGSSITVAKP